MQAKTKRSRWIEAKMIEAARPSHWTEHPLAHHLAQKIRKADGAVIFTAMIDGRIIEASEPEAILERLIDAGVCD
jgi:hypothetical protein